MSAQDAIEKVKASKSGQDKQSAGTNLLALIEQQKPQIARALPKHLDVERVIRIAWTAIRKNPDLLRCSQASVLTAVMEASQLGLELDGALGKAYLVPYRNRDVMEAQMQLGYRGLITLAQRGGVDTVEAEVVRVGDQFDYEYGTGSFLRHRPADDDDGELLKAWCMYTRGGVKSFRVLSKRQIERARKASKGASYPSSPWNQWPEAMWCKTAIRATLKRTDLDADVARAIANDEARELGLATADDAEMIDVTPEPAPAPAPEEAG